MSAPVDPPPRSRHACRIVPQLPPTTHDEGDTQLDNDDDPRDDESTSSQLSTSIIRDADSQPESYSIPPPPQRVAPAENFEDLYELMDDSSEADGEDEPMTSNGNIEDEYVDNDVGYIDGSLPNNTYQPGFRPQAAVGQQVPNARDTCAHSRSTSADGLPALPGAFVDPSQRRQLDVAQPPARQEGQTSTSAIVIQDSPTPPLRPLASPQARLAASTTGRCAALDDSEASVPAPVDEKKTSLGELVCPICLGPPSPLVITECGHTL